MMTLSLPRPILWQGQILSLMFRMVKVKKGHFSVVVVLCDMEMQSTSISTLESKVI